MKALLDFMTVFFIAVPAIAVVQIIKTVIIQKKKDMTKRKEFMEMISEYKINAELEKERKDKHEKS